MPDPPDALPYALADDTHGLGPVLADLTLQHRNPVIHFRLTQLRAILRRPGHDIRVPERELPRQLFVLRGCVPARSEAAAVQQLPEQIAGMGVRVSGACGLNAGVEAD